MRPRVGEYPFTLKEHVLIHLSEQKVSREPDAPHSITQEGISMAVGARRGNVARALKDLQAKGLLVERKARPLGRSHMQKCYGFTDEGRRVAIALAERTQRTMININTATGDRKIPLSDMPGHLPGGGSLTEVIRFVRFSKFDVKRYEMRRVLVGTGGYATKSVPQVDSFYGRASELGVLVSWGVGKGPPTVAVVGMAGIGKTTLIARAAKDWSMRSNVYWFQVREWTTPAQMVEDIGNYLRSFGLLGVSSALTCGGWDIGTLSVPLSRDLSNIRLIIVLDDVHLANLETIRFIKMMFDIVSAGKQSKLVVLSRRRTNIYGRADVISKRVVEMKLAGLDDEASKCILRARRIDSPRILTICRGNPLFLRIIPPSSELRDSPLADYLLDEILRDLSPDEKEAFDLICLTREGIPTEALIKTFGFDIAHIESLLDRGLLARSMSTSVRPHDLMAEITRGRMSGAARTRAHLALGHYFSVSIGSASALEAIYHLWRGGATPEAKELFVKLADELISGGHIRGLADVAESLALDQGGEDERVTLALAKIYTHVGRWEDALGVFEQCARAARESGNLRAQCESILERGGILLRQGKRAKALRDFESGARLAGRIGWGDGEARAMYEIGSMVESDNPEMACTLFERCKELAKQCGSPRFLAMAYYGLGRLDEAKGRFQLGRSKMEKALKLLEGLGDNVTRLKLLISLGKNSFQTNDLGTAIEYYEGAVKLAIDNVDARAEGYALANLGGVFIEKPDFITAEKNLTKALKIFEGLGEQRMVASVHGNLALIFLKRGDAASGLEHAKKQLTMVTELDITSRLSKSHALVGLALKDLGRYKEARFELTMAISLAEKFGLRQDVKEIQKDLRETASQEALSTDHPGSVECL
jgi:tetratricopeptide (TPR) repeat protein